MYKSTIRFLIWLMTLNLLMNFIFPEPVELWKFLLIETCLGFLSFVMVDWKEDKWGERMKIFLAILILISSLNINLTLEKLNGTKKRYDLHCIVSLLAFVLFIFFF